MYAIDDCELVRSYMTLAMARLARRLHRYLFAISTLLYVRIRTSVESKRPNSVHILSETSLSFYLSYLIYRWPIYRVIFLLHESIIRRYWPTWISIVFIGFTGSRMCIVPLFRQVYTILNIMSVQNVYFRLTGCQWLTII